MLGPQPFIFRRFVKNKRDKEKNGKERDDTEYEKYRGDRDHLIYRS
jgi:hypothetical protein